MNPQEAASPTTDNQAEDVWQWLLRQRADPSADDARPACAAEIEQAFLELYESFAASRTSGARVVAHLGQSIDGFIATAEGDSYFVTGPENLDHLHRMRALADAVVVGAGTVETDDPSLTTRRVAGPNATRVILEGRRPLADSHNVFFDGLAETLLVRCGSTAGSTRHGNAEVAYLPSEDGLVAPRALIDLLVQRGLRRIFIEGGGKVVSGFLSAGVLDRLQLAIAPVLIGSGRRGIVAPAHARMLDCLRPAHRLYRMGDDLLFDYDLQGSEAGELAAGATLRRLR
jgi:riboflavin-specific deaminase-like protein